MDTRADVKTIQSQARLVGFLYLATNITAIIGFSARARVLALNDANRTLRNVAASEGLLRLDLGAELVTVAGVIGLISALYLILRPIGRWTALTALLWRLTENLVLVVTPLGLFTILALGGGRVDGPDPLQSQALVYAALREYSGGFKVGFLFLGLGSTLFSLLWFRSRYIPRWLAGWGIFASIVMAGASLALMVFPDLTTKLSMAYMAPIGVYELGLGFWLLVRGVKLPVAD